jgi:putative transposase
LLLQRSSFYYRSKRKQYVALKMRLKELTLVRIRFGYPQLMVLLKREGWAVGRKLVYRLCREMELHVRSKRGRRKLARDPAFGVRPVPEIRTNGSTCAEDFKWKSEIYYGM